MNLIDINELRNELGFAEHCENCKQNEWHCQRDCYYSLMDFCERLDIAIETILERHKKEQEAVEPRVSSVEQRCGNCNKIIEMDGWKACPWCGKPIDWEGWWKKNGTRNQDT